MAGITDPSEPSPRAPKITTFSDLDGVTEVFSHNKEQDTLRINYTIFYIFSEDDMVFLGQILGKGKREIPMGEFFSALKHVPDDQLHPLLPPDVQLTVASNLDGDAYIKRARLSDYDDSEEGWIPKLLLQEALIIEQLAKHPHENIVRYHGCRVHRGRITGIVLDRYEYTLIQHFRHISEGVEIDRFMTALESAVEHLHSIGLAHNDLNPNNILMNRDGMPILIDFGSCQPFGKKLMTLATEGWYDEPITSFSEQKKDTVALAKIRSWLENPNRNLES